MKINTDSFIGIGICVLGLVGGRICDWRPLQDEDHVR